MLEKAGLNFLTATWEYDFAGRSLGEDPEDRRVGNFARGDDGLPFEPTLEFGISKRAAV